MLYLVGVAIAFCMMVSFIISGAFAIAKGTTKMVLLGAILQVLGIITSVVLSGFVFLIVLMGAL